MKRKSTARQLQSWKNYQKRTICSWDMWKVRPVINIPNSAIFRKIHKIVIFHVFQTKINRHTYVLWNRFWFYLTDRLNAELEYVKKINMIPISVFKAWWSWKIGAFCRFSWMVHRQCSSKGQRSNSLICKMSKTLKCCDQFTQNFIHIIFVNYNILIHRKVTEIMYANMQIYIST